ncbi:hypothetical protein BC835DRAFT_1415220 [Cytidiella melzeri]|nr:hypothetical protein BC835DRAFT_1415220 [Cytidiella melzeri]
MSFASTPLGQGRRLDHHTFLKKGASTSIAGSSTHATAASQRPHTLRQNLSTNPVSYSYGAPTATSRSPPKPERSTATEQTEEHASDSEQPALVRFARLKQQEQAQQQQHTHVVGPRIINTPPNPSRWSVKDTSVNIASAFHQAASYVVPAYDTSTSSNGSGNQNSSTSTSTIMNPNDSWASNAQRKAALPRSTSVEYEKEQQAVSRRLANPPPRSNLARPPSRVVKVPSVRHVPDSEGEDEGASIHSRGKSPFEQVVDMSKKLTQIAPTTFFLRRQSEEPEARPAVHDQSASYDYSAEEREFQASSLQDKSNSMDQRGTIVRRRNRISVDAKAYKPTVSDMEESDGELEEDGKRTRRKKGKKGTAGGHLTSLPVVGYDKRRKGRKGTRENGAEEDGENGDEVQEVSEASVAAERAARATTTVIRPPSVARTSMTPSLRQSVPRESVPPEPQYDSSGMNGFGDVESGLLHSIPEMDEPSFGDEADSSTEVLSQRSFSVGATLGRGVHWVVSLFSALARGMWTIVTYLPLLVMRTFALLIHVLVLDPARRLSQTNFAPLYRLVPSLVVGLGIYAAWSAANSGYLSGLVPSRPLSPPTYLPPSESAPADLTALSDRLLRLENAVSSLSIDSTRTRTYIEGDAREQALLTGRLSNLENRIAKESTNVVDLESRLRTTMNQGVQAVKQELAILHAQLEEQQRAAKQRGDTASDREARAKIKALEERVGSVEGGVKEAIELGKSAKHEGPVGALPTWLKDFARGKTSVTIKSTDGQDVSSLVNKLVESAVAKASRDGLARPDYAMYSSGGSIVPSLTSLTYEVKPHGVTSQILGMFTGQGSAVGRPPVTILHHENHNGHCWPFPGSQGQVGVMLAYPTRISDVTIDHVSREVATDMRSAPRQMEVWGLVEGADNVGKHKLWNERRDEARTQAELLGEEYEEEEIPSTLPRGAPFIRLASFSYNAHSSNEIQTFPVAQDVQDLDMDFGIVVLVVKSNWGREEFTCLYRFRVHGERADGMPALLPEDSA